MKEYIEREEAIDYLMTNMGWYDENGYSVDDYDEKYVVISDLISGVPTADVRPVVRGKWCDTNNYYQRWKCSVCGSHTRDARPPFCPNCGADMREANDGI